MASLTINKATPTVAWPPPADIVYGTPLGPAQLDATASIPGSFGFNPLAGIVLGAMQDQTLTVTFTPTDSADFLTVTASVAINVTQAPLTITADNASRVEGTQNPSFTVQYAGFVNGGGPSSLGGVLTFTTSANASSPPGEYPITPGGLTSANYSITYVSRTLTVTPAPTPPSTPTPTPTPSPTSGPVTVQDIHRESLKLSKKKSSKVLVVSLSGALEPGPAQNVGEYQLTVKKAGTRTGIPVALASVVYNAAMKTVTLTPRGAVPNGTLQLTINAPLISDAQGQPVQGNNQPRP
jgi:hypothetical protein